MSELATSGVEGKKLRRKNYRMKKRRFGGSLGTKERLRSQLTRVQLTCQEVEEAGAVLKEEEARLRKENTSLKRLLVLKDTCALPLVWHARPRIEDWEGLVTPIIIRIWCLSP